MSRFVLCAYDIHHLCEDDDEVPMAVTKCITCHRPLCEPCAKDHEYYFGRLGRWSLGCAPYCEKEMDDA